MDSKDRIREIDRKLTNVYAAIEDIADLAKQMKVNVTADSGGICPSFDETNDEMEFLSLDDNLIKVFAYLSANIYARLAIVEVLNDEEFVNARKEIKSFIDGVFHVDSTVDTQRVWESFEKTVNIVLDDLRGYMYDLEENKQQLSV